MHEGGSYWLNTVLLTSSDVRSLVGSHASKQRVESLFTLGISLSKIITLNTGISIVRAFSQLMEEWEYVHAGPTMQGVKFMMAKTSPCLYPQMSPIDGLSDLSRPSVYKFNNAVVFEHLQLPHIPYDLDYAEVFVSLCTQFCRLYDKLVHEECYTNQVVYDAIVRLDTRVKHHVINQVAKELTEACARKMKGATRALRSLAGMQWSSSAAASTKATATAAGAGAGAGVSSPALAKASSSPSLGLAAGTSAQRQRSDSPATVEGTGNMVGTKPGIAAVSGGAGRAGVDAAQSSPSATAAATAVSVENPARHSNSNSHNRSSSQQHPAGHDARDDS